MIEIAMRSIDLAQVRFAYSPMRELAASVRVITDKSRHYMYSQWLAAVLKQTGSLKLDRIEALFARGVPPSFVMPSPSALWTELTDDLGLIASTPAHVIHDQLFTMNNRRGTSDELRTLYDDPLGQLPALLDEIRDYWRLAIGPVWQHIRALCMADVSYRADQFVSGGIARVLAGLHPSLLYDNSRLIIEDSQKDYIHVDLDGGILLAPCVFSWPTLDISFPSQGSKSTDRNIKQAILCYPPRGIATLWQSIPTRSPAPLHSLVGATRATLLALLKLPATTTQLARELDISAAAVSNHLKIPKLNGLASARRNGKTVLYQRTAAADALLAIVEPGRGGL